MLLITTCTHVAQYLGKYINILLGCLIVLFVNSVCLLSALQTFNVKYVAELYYICWIKSPPVVYFPQLTLTSFCCFADGPQMLMVERERDTYYPGDTIKVTTESNPSDRTYEWVNASTDAILGREDTFLITEEMLGSQSLKVIVYNIIPIPHANAIYKECQLHFTVIRK